MNSFSTLTGLQLMRALACLAVVVYHAAEMWRTRLSPGGTVVWPLGAAGVDVFFVISGFVMVLSASRRANWRAFLRARLRRIVPLYWLCSLAKMGGLFAAGDTARLGLSYCLRSLLFLPVHDAAGLLKPVLPVGWTLSFEMLFYGLCAVALGAGMAPAVFVPPVLLALSLVPHGGSALGELASPIVLEFVYGMALAVLWRPALLVWCLCLKFCRACGFSTGACRRRWRWAAWCAWSRSSHRISRVFCAPWATRPMPSI
jgi:exopolysaccharide production protein ExoZ